MLAAYDLRLCWNRQTGKLEVLVSAGRTGSSPVGRTKERKMGCTHLFFFVEKQNATFKVISYKKVTFSH